MNKPAYLVVDARAKVPGQMDEYRRLAQLAVEKFGGRYLVRGASCEILEGEWHPERLVIAADTAVVSAHGVNSRGGRVPFSGRKIRAEILEGASLGRIEQAGETVRFISLGMEEGEVLLLIHIEGWPLPSQVTIRISAPMAAQSINERRSKT